MGAHSLRSVPLTGTPFCNGVDDLASIMTLINPNLKSAKSPYWKRVTDKAPASQVVESCSNVTTTFFVRREKEAVLKDMVKKISNREVVQQYRAEQLSYEPYEASLLDVLKRFSRISDIPEHAYEMKQLFTCMMSLMSSMRQANTHAMLPGGREWTITFSPTRRHLVSKESRISVCVCCNRNTRPSIPICDGRVGHKIKNSSSLNPGFEEFENGLDDDDPEDCENEENGGLDPIPALYCRSRRVRHYAHPKCLEEITDGCPRCLHKDKVFEQKYPGCKRYCQSVDGGFPGSSKIDAVIEWQSALPTGDKVCSSSVTVMLDVLFHAQKYSHGVPPGRP